ncbi:MAG: hypothetical protein GXZ01_03240 [Clostridiaceae bacterium]|jgi:hypothetical protein|nr:hypothetical protein [Clostridiaceae bacterium]
MGFGNIVYMNLTAEMERKNISRKNKEITPIMMALVQVDVHNSILY